MNINNSVSSLNMSANLTANNQAVGERRPPPPGGIPPGLAEPVSTLDADRQQELMSMLESFTKEQHDELKTALDNLKPNAESMSSSEVGEEFYQLVSTIFQPEEPENEQLVDLYV